MPQHEPATAGPQDSPVWRQAAQNAGAPSQPLLLTDPSCMIVLQNVALARFVLFANVAPVKSEPIRHVPLRLARVKLAPRALMPFRLARETLHPVQLSPWKAGDPERSH